MVRDALAGLCILSKYFQMYDMLFVVQICIIRASMQSCFHTARCVRGKTYLLMFKINKRVLVA